MHIYISIYIYIYLSIYLYLYIYIYTPPSTSAVRACTSEDCAWKERRLGDD